MTEQTNVQRVQARFEDLPPELAAAITAAIVSDSLDSLGVRHQVMSSSVASLAGSGRVVGRARTIQYAPTEADSADPYGEAMRFIDGLDQGSVAVIATGSDARTAYWGELFSAAAMGHGAVGAICDGPVRDVAKIRDLDFAVFAAGTRPIDFRARMRVVSIGETIRCGGVLVSAGDLVVGDGDGVVVVPAAFEAETIERAAARAAAESTVLAELLGGASLRAVWDRWRVL